MPMDGLLVVIVFGNNSYDTTPLVFLLLAKRIQAGFDSLSLKTENTFVTVTNIEFAKEGLNDVPNSSI
ncbi:hypothetical protein [Paenibacillus wynnii]|uniref:Uncharacterized protein n=1 Tax=Paenibacillus wynnii TaxID=268407 RepID=A0A098MB75_9BACL|nr:hypothetical protein [Paenibacillus wynnii]KGE18802.1 hypothetical protein PWYN_05030 [Paenibacillus wynnii]